MAEHEQSGQGSMTAGTAAPPETSRAARRYLALASVAAGVLFGLASVVLVWVVTRVLRW